MKLWIAFLLAMCATAQVRVKLGQRDGGRIVDLPLEQYVAAVLAGETSVFRSDEALKAMAVTVRTYALRLKGRHKDEGFDLCGNTHCQLVDLKAVQPRYTRAAEATTGELLWVQGKLVLSAYSMDCGGRTEDIDVVWPGTEPALRGVLDPYCMRAGAGKWQWSASGERIATALRRSGLKTPPTIDRIRVVKRTPSGRASVVSLGNVPLAATSLRFALGREIGWNTLRSELWEVEGEGGEFVFQGCGTGHGAGLCQRGADQQGVEGRSYREILHFYFPGASVARTARAIDWTRQAGERVTLFTTRPSRDGEALANAERIAAELALKPGVELRIYPDVETFRNATSEPGWVAAHTTGRTVDLQPLTGPTLDRTLRHELLHVMLNDRRTVGVPVWFLEGLVAHFEARGTSTSTTTPSDAAIRQTADPELARIAYDYARKRVAALITKHGESTVLSWLTRGLPAQP